MTDPARVEAAAMPLIRASYAKMAVGGMKQLPAEKRTRTLNALGEPLRQQIRESGLLSWIPLPLFLSVVTAIERALGPRDAHDFWKSNLLDALNRPLLKPLRVGALALYGNTPRSLLIRAPHAWSLVAKHCGDCDVHDDSEGALTIYFTALPQALRETPGILKLWAGGADGCIVYCGKRGQVVIHADELTQGRAAFEVRWE